VASAEFNYTRTCCCYCFTVTDVFQGKRVDSLIQGGIRTNVASVEFDTRLNMLLLFCHSHRHSPVPLFVFCYKVVGRQCSAVVIVRHSRRLSHYCQTITYHEVNHTRSSYHSGTHSYHQTEHRSHLSGNSRVHTLEEESKATMTHTEGFFSLRVCACM